MPLPLVEAYASEDGDRKAAFDAIMQDWDEGAAPSRAEDWAKDTDRSGREVPVPGAPPYVTDTTPGGDDEGGPEYETELSGS
ncbi:hypothetical protein LO763_19400 [Glycomyces sp. A-F 0318]|uniref:hypothetical protein n=1 Tax=Glycomyces amatae TaxID=2881355 RepID=UPI001E3FE344|nr:hypothetical protein [Glycomyces amatae]MCD0445778.1 hypothetical protein [Glycomyces amatae]